MKLKCAISSNSTNLEKSCFDKDSLYELAKSLKIPIEKLHAKIIKQCPDESCIPNLAKRSKLLNQKLKDQIVKYSLRPFLDGNLNDWMSTTDIDNIMSQYIFALNKKGHNILYLGALPADILKAQQFDNDPKLLKRFGFDKSAKCDKIVAVLNTDIHLKPGHHWTCVCVDGNLKTVEFFDPLGNPPNNHVEKFLNIFVVDQNFKLIVSTKKHQRGNIMCGAYCCYYVLLRLLNVPIGFFDERISDTNMKIFKKDLFN